MQAEWEQVPASAEPFGPFHEPLRWARGCGLARILPGGAGGALCPQVGAGQARGPARRRGCGERAGWPPPWPDSPCPRLPRAHPDRFFGFSPPALGAAAAEEAEDTAGDGRVPEIAAAMSQPPAGGAAAEPRLHPEGSSGRKQPRASSPARARDTAPRPPPGAAKPAPSAAKAASARPPPGPAPRAARGRAAEKPSRGAVQPGPGAEPPPAAAGRGAAAAAAAEEPLPPPGAAEEAPPAGSGGGEREGAAAPPPKQWRGKAGRSPLKGAGEAAPAPPSSSGAGKGRGAAAGGGGYWKEGCLQSELIQFHLRKGLAAAAQMQTKGSNHSSSSGSASSAASAASAAAAPAEPPPAASASSPAAMAAAGAEGLRQGEEGGDGRSCGPEGALSPHLQEEMEEEMEKLREENESLKVRGRRGGGGGGEPGSGGGRAVSRRPRREGPSRPPSLSAGALEAALRWLCRGAWGQRRFPASLRCL